MRDTLKDGRVIRLLNIVDDCSRECLAIEIDTSLTGRRVVAVLERLADERSLPHTIVVDNALPRKSRLEERGSKAAPASAGVVPEEAFVRAASALG